MSNSPIIYPFENGTDSYDVICKDLIVGVIRGFAGLISVILVFQHLHQINNPAQPDNLVEMQTVFGFYCLYAQWDDDDEQSRISRQQHSRGTDLQNMRTELINASTLFQQLARRLDDEDCTEMFVNAHVSNYQRDFPNGGKHNISYDCYSFQDSQKSFTDCWGF